MRAGGILYIKDLMAQDDQERFEATLWPHLGAAYNLARWLTRRPDDAEDVVQEALLRAYRFFGQCRGDSARAWLMRIVRNTAYRWLQQNRGPELASDAELAFERMIDPAPGPETQALRTEDHALVREAVAALPLEFREVLVLRELEDLSYQEICEVTGLPMGTVMSRLSRARDRLQILLRSRRSGERTHGL